MPMPSRPSPRRFAVLALCALAACTLSTDPPPDFQAQLQQRDFPWVDLSWQSITVPSGTPQNTIVTYRVERRLPGEADFGFVADVLDRNPTAPKHSFHYGNYRIDETNFATDPDGRIAAENRLPEDALIEYRVFAFHAQYGETKPAYASVRSGINEASPTSWSTETAAVTLEWTDNSLIEEGYTIYRAPADADGSVTYLFGSNGWRLDLFDHVADVDANVTSYVDATAVSGERYLYLVETWNHTRALNAFRVIGDTASGILAP